MFDSCPKSIPFYGTKHQAATFRKSNKLKLLTLNYIDSEWSLCFASRIKKCVIGHFHLHSHRLFTRARENCNPCMRETNKLRRKQTGIVDFICRGISALVKGAAHPQGKQ